MGWHYRSIRTLPAPLDIVWCRFPIDELPNKPGPKPRPGLIRAIKIHKDQQRSLVEVSYGTSKKSAQEYPFELHVSNMREMNEAGLPQATCFVLGRCLWLPWAEEFFEMREDGTGPVIGSLSMAARMQLEVVKVMRRKVGM